MACDGVAECPREHSHSLIAREDTEDAEVLVLRFPDGETSLPLFGLEEEAGMFLWLETAGEGWGAVEISGAGLVALLRGPCAGVRRIFRPFAAGGIGERPASLDREEFLRNLGQAGPPPVRRAGRAQGPAASAKSAEGRRGGRDIGRLDDEVAGCH